MEADLNRGPAAHGWAEDQRWTLERVAEVIRRLFGTGYTRPGVSLLLRRNGWSVQVPDARSSATTRRSRCGSRRCGRKWNHCGGPGAWICFEDQAGQGLRPPKGRSWSRR
ncbi:winged helix-turn-helix domain-containing protein [Actinomadura geliboluensis]|uniref:winged helix-turn-helix domain-containing protein n=1 Tax=Actinomadura geliboluensis TaxID=882440 RepID=UPI003687478A